MVKCFSKSKNMKKLLPIFIALFLCASCDKEERATVDCLEQVLADLNMVPYIGQEFDCEMFLLQYTFRRKQYYLIHNHCFPINTFVADCEKNRACVDNDPDLCNNLYLNMLQNGTIVGITP